MKKIANKEIPRWNDLTADEIVFSDEEDEKKLKKQ